MLPRARGRPDPGRGHQAGGGPKPPAPGATPQLREGLSIRQLTPDEREDKLFRYGWSDRPEEAWWTVEYGKKYRAITMAFMQTVMSGGKQLDGWSLHLV